MMHKGKMEKMMGKSPMAAAAKNVDEAIALHTGHMKSSKPTTPAEEAKEMKFLKGAKAALSHMED